jgi:hypothetical protein
VVKFAVVMESFKDQVVIWMLKSLKCLLKVSCCHDLLAMLLDF